MHVDRELAFLSDGGAMGELIRAADWSSTAFGSPNAWSQPLRTLVGVMLGSSQPMFVVWGAERRLLYNDTYALICAERHPAALGACFAEVWHDVYGTVGPLLERAYAGHGTHMPSLQLTLQRNGRGEEAHFSFSYTPVRNDHGGVVGVFCACAEITAQVIADRRVEAQAARQRRLFEQAPGFIAMLAGPEQRFEFVNQAHVRLFGDRGLVGRTLREGFPDLADQGIVEAVERVYASGQRLVAHRQRLRIAATGTTDGAGARELLLDFVVEPMHDERGAVCGIFIEGHDVTEEAAATAALALERARLRAVFEALPVGIVLAEAPGGRVVESNRQVEVITGRPAADWSDLAAAAWGAEHADGRPVAPAEHPLARVLAGGEARPELEALCRRDDGSRHWVRFVGAPIRDADGVLRGGVVALLDIDRKRRALDALHDADRSKNEFLAMLAHELRNPLASIRYAGALLQGSGTPQAIDKASRVIERQTAQMARLLDDLLDVSRITRGTIELQREVIDFRAAIELGLETSRPMIEARRHTLTLGLADRPVEVSADAARLAQVVGNLLHNAAKFTEPGGRIAVVLEREGAEAVLRISDTGEGLAPQSTERIFELFEQVRSGSQGARGGLGIGLSVARRLVELHGGRLLARSDGPGLGAEFTIRLPLVGLGEAMNGGVGGDGGASPAASPAGSPVASPAGSPATSAAEPAATDPVAADRPQPPNGLSVMVVDDNADAADTLAMLLELRGHRVEVAYGGTAAIERAATLRPQVMVLDLGMPGTSGFDVVAAVRRQAWGGAVRIVAATGWGQEADRARTRAAGFDAHLVKPIDPDELQRLLQAWGDAFRAAAG